MQELKNKKSVPTIVRSMLRDGIPSQKKLKDKITRAAKKEEWSDADKEYMTFKYRCRWQD